MIPPTDLRALIEMGRETMAGPWHYMESQDEVWDHEGHTLVEFSSPCSALDKQFMVQAANLAVPLATELMAARAALESIAKNTCCGPCQEAALVAKRALGGG